VGDDKNPTFTSNLEKLIFWFESMIYAKQEQGIQK
jgi:hypothetical protein